MRFTQDNLRNFFLSKTTKVKFITHASQEVTSYKTIKVLVQTLDSNALMIIIAQSNRYDIITKVLNVLINLVIEGSFCCLLKELYRPVFRITTKYLYKPNKITNDNNPVENVKRKEPSKEEELLKFMKVMIKKKDKKDSKIFKHEMFILQNN